MFTDPAERAYETLQPHGQERIVSKLDEIVGDRWRDPSDYLEPFTGAPHSKLRIGAFRLGCKAMQTERVLWVYTIEKRSGAYKPGDD
jgi:mRNA-degrading endonuclease RelE of RelBE toxin-antitoxin system